MVVLNNVKKIVTLCHEIGDKDGYGGGDCVQYFPLKNELVAGEYTITLESQELEKSMDKRILVVTKEGEKLKVEHIHFKAWPDWQVPKEYSMV